MADIKLNPQDLLAQAAEMNSIKSAYESLNTQLLNALNGINDSWSENIAGNFIGKIQSAKKSFLSIVNMMGNGSTAARVSALSFLEPNQILAGFGFADMGDGNINGGELAEKLMQILKDSGYDKEISRNMENLSEIFRELDDAYWNAPEAARFAIDQFLEIVDDGMEGDDAPYSPKKYVDAYKILKKVSEGDYNGAVSDFGKKLLKGGIKEAFDLPSGNPLSPASLLGIDETSLKTGYAINLIEDTAESATLAVIDPNLKNTFGFAWNTAIEPILETSGDAAFNVVKYIPGIGNYYTDQGARCGSDAFQIMLGDMTKTFTGDYEAAEYDRNYYTEHDGFYGGVYDGIADIVNFVNEQGGIVNASKQFWKSAFYEE